MIIDIVTLEEYNIADFIKKNPAARHLIKENPTKHFKYRYCLKENKDKFIKIVLDQDGVIYRLITPSTMNCYFDEKLTNSELVGLSAVLNNKLFSARVKDKIVKKEVPESENIKNYQRAARPPAKIISDRYKKYRERNIHFHNQRCKQWKEKNKTRVAEYNRQYSQNRRDTDINFKIRVNYRTRVRTAMLGQRKCAATMNLLGCDASYLREYLSSKFTQGMSWENYGRTGWHIDHIIPCSSFDLSKEEEQRKCFHYTNLQPLWAEDNISKGCKIVPQNT